MLNYIGSIFGTVRQMYKNKTKQKLQLLEALRIIKEPNIKAYYHVQEQTYQIYYINSTQRHNIT